MHIEVWSDYVCPFCYIGKRKLEEALATFPHKDDVKVEYKSYLLDPNSPPYTGQDYYETLAKKFGSVEQVKQMTANVAEQAKLVGLDYDFDTMKPTNTMTAHRLTKFAEAEGKDLAMTEALLQAHFLDGKDIGDKETLVAIAEEIGLDADAAGKAIDNEKAYKTEVEADLQEAQAFQITGVPFFIFNRKYALSGAQPTETFTQALEKIYEETKKESPFQSLDTDSGAACDDQGNCEIPK